MHSLHITDSDFQVGAHEPFSCVGAARPRQIGSQQLVSSDAVEEDNRDYDFIWDHVGWSPCATNGGENGPFVGKREARDAELPSWTEGWLYSWLLRKAQLCGWQRISGVEPSSNNVAGWAFN